MARRLYSFLAGLLFVALIAVLDIAVVEFILNDAGITDQYVWVWHVALFAIFMPGLFLLVWLGMGRLDIAIWTAGLTLGGWEDALYFWLQGQTVPAALPWHPYLTTDVMVYAAMVFSFTVLWLAVRGRDA